MVMMLNFLGTNSADGRVRKDLNGNFFFRKLKLIQKEKKAKMKR